MVRPLWKIVWNFFKKLKMELPFDPAIPRLGTYPKNPEIPVQKNICTLMCIAVLFTVAKIWKEARCPSADEWVKNWYVYIMEYYVAIKKKKLYLL